ncbi:MAG: serine hydrolase [Victivallales bacterium]|nr:serine hydrolase [Victivallales bacterium]
MKKFITFIIVLLVQLSIIYGLYRWYVGDKAEAEKQPQSSIKEKTGQTANVNKKEKVSPTEKKSIKKIPEKVSEQTKPSKTTIKDEHKNKETSKPLIFRYTEWGNIPSLPESKLARTGILVDIDKRTVLWSKSCRRSVPIASMTKMMTALLAFEEIKNNPDINLNTVIKVTKEAYRIGGSQVWLDPRESFTMKQLLKTIMIKSANDSAYLVAQFLGHGDVDIFVNEMNEKADMIGMSNAHFSNPDGLPEKYSSDDNRATAEGLVFLAEHLMKYPLAMKWAKTKIDWFRQNSKNPTMLVNTNHLVRDRVKGVNGLKTGYTSRAGFCLTATCTRGHTTLIAVVTGFKNRKARDRFTTALISWGFRKNARISK